MSLFFLVSLPSILIFRHLGSILRLLSIVRYSKTANNGSSARLTKNVEELGNNNKKKGLLSFSSYRIFPKT